MKKELRNRLLYLIYELEQKNISGVSAQEELKQVFEMLQILVDENTFAAIEELWRNRYEGEPTFESLTLGLMKFDREVRFLLIEKKYI